MQVKIATLNLCLGLKMKKDMVKRILNEKNIDILAMQETEIDNDIDEKFLMIPGYRLEMETNKYNHIFSCDLNYTHTSRIAQQFNNSRLPRSIWG